MEPYFARFPTIIYNNVECRNISKNVVLSPNIGGQPVLFYPYELKDGQRPDLVAQYYYGDSYLDWLIFIANGITDPYYDWYLSDDDFNKFLIKKYGSVEITQERVKYYSVNWSDDTAEVSVSFYQNVLPEALKKYYSPIFGHGGKVLSYNRRKEDWIADTNQILRFNVDANGFSNGELVTIKNTGIVVGGGEVITANSTVVKVQHISGNTSANNQLIGLTSNAIANITESNVLVKVVSDEEFAFWAPVYIYEYERQKNEKNKNIYLIDNRYSMPIVETMRAALKQ